MIMQRFASLQPRGSWVAWRITVVLCLLHAWAIFAGMGGRKGLTNEWPIWRDDHPLYFHSATVTSHFLKQSATTAGYDPSFMSGYAKSVVFPASSTLPELVITLFGGERPEFAYKLYVLLAASCIPWLLAWAACLWRLSAWSTTSAVFLFLAYVWTDFPINYAAFGMLPYLLMVPLGLVAIGAFCRYLEHGGFWNWCVSTCLMISVLLVHLTAAMVVAPAAALAYGVALWRGGGPALASESGTPMSSASRFTRAKHLGVLAIPVLVLAANAFWWLPGIWLASTKGSSDFAFDHPEGVWRRLLQILTVEAPMESMLWGLGLLGLAGAAGRCRTRFAGLLGYIAAGFFWGYLAGATRTLDFLQPGRHTYAVYTGLALAAAIGLSETLTGLRSSVPGRKLDYWFLCGLLLIGARILFPSIQYSVTSRLGERPFLASEPSPRLRWIVGQVQTWMKPGERLLYEESGKDLPGIPDPFEGGRFSGLLPDKTGIEVLGGPYLYASLKTNFVQFGEGKLFGEREWTRAHFERHARLYRPSYMMCWSPWARAFCQSNPDLIKILADDGTCLFARVVGYEGFTIEGTAHVDATPGRLVVSGLRPGVDGSVVLRYHSVPCLRIDPPTRWEPVLLEQDPTPFIRLHPGKEPLTVELRFPPGGDRGPKP